MSLFLHDMNTTTNSTANQSYVRPHLPPNPNAAKFFEFAFASSIYMTVVAFITVVANSLLLLIFYVDPLKTFRNPTSYFLIGLAFVDLITGLVQEPIFASCFMMGYLGNPAAKQHCPTLFQTGRVLALTTMNASFIIVFNFTVTQLIVVASPLHYATLITKKKVIMAVLVIYVYTITFGLLFGLVNLPDPDTYSKVDLFLHSFFVIYVTIAFYSLLYRSFKRQMASSKSLRSESVLRETKSSTRRNRVERKFIAVNFLLISVVFFCSQPSAILWLLKLYWFSTPPPFDVDIASLMVENVLYLKFMLDPFVYAWRLPKYRQALRMILCCRSKKQETETTLSTQVTAHMSKSTETVVTLSFRSLAV